MKVFLVNIFDKYVTILYKNNCIDVIVSDIFVDKKSQLVIDQRMMHEALTLN